VDAAGVFHKIPHIDDTRLAEIFAREVLADLVRKELLSPEWAERILSWRHTGFSVHSRVRAKTKPESERVGKYMIRPILSLERLSLDDKQGQVMVRYHGLYANAHRGKVRKVNLAVFPLRVVEAELRPVPSKGWAAMIRKVYEVDPLLCPRCGGRMKVNISRPRRPRPNISLKPVSSQR